MAFSKASFIINNNLDNPNTAEAIKDWLVSTGIFTCVYEEYPTTDRGSVYLQHIRSQRSIKISCSPYSGVISKITIFKTGLNSLPTVGNAIFEYSKNNPATWEFQIHYSESAFLFTLGFNRFIAGGIDLDGNFYQAFTDWNWSTIYFNSETEDTDLKTNNYQSNEKTVDEKNILIPLLFKNGISNKVIGISSNFFGTPTQADGYYILGDGRIGYCKGNVLFLV